MKFYLHQFRSNNPDLKLEDVITNSKAGVDTVGIGHINFCTVEKYVRVFTNNSVYCPKYKANVITIKPFIYDENGNDIYGSDAYYEHPSFYIIEFAVVFGEDVCNVLHTTPLKYEYYIQVIPHDLAFNYRVLKEIELIVLDEEE